MSGNVGFVERCGVVHHVYALEASPYRGAIDNGSNFGCEWGREDVKSNNVVIQALQSTQQRLAQVPGTSCHENSHFCETHPVRRVNIAGLGQTITEHCGTLPAASRRRHMRL